MAKSRITYVVEDDVDRKIEVIAALERKPKSVVIEEALQRHIDAKDLPKLLSSKPRARASAAGVSGQRK